MVKAQERTHDVCARLLPAGGIAIKIREPEIGDAAVGDLFLEQVNFVEE